MFVPKNTHVPEPPTKKLKTLAAASFAAFLLLSLAVISLSLLLVQKNHTVKKQSDDIATLSSTLEKVTDELTKSKRLIAAAQALPALDSFNEQCPGGNKAEGLFTLLNTTPIEGYNIVAVTCKKELATGNAKTRILVFRVNGDGTKEFTYASSAEEIPCIPSKLPVANAVASKLEMSVCSKS